MNYRILLLCLLPVVGGVAAEPGEFVRGRVIEELADQNVLRVVVPQDVYEWVTRWDLGDVRVFNAAGGEVPYRIQRPQGTKEFSDWIDLPVFEIPAPQASAESGTRVDIQLDDVGAVVAVNGVVPGSAASGAYLFDASKLKGRFSQMRVGWRPGPEGFVGKFRLEASDDLNTWRSVVDSATLADLSTGTNEVLLNVIELEPARGKYLRLTQLDGNERLSVDALAVRSRQTQLRARQWKTLAAAAVEDGFEFHTGGLFPLDRVTLEMDQPSYLVVGKLFSRAGPKDQWRSRGQRTFYATAVDGVQVTSRPVASGSNDQYWRVELQSESGGEPKLRVGWRPDEVVFLNQSPLPLLLAYGRAGIESKQWPLRELLALAGEDTDTDELVTVSLGAPTTLGGPAMRQAAPEPIDWQTVLLWSALLLGVLVVGGFAYRLVKASD